MERQVTHHSAGGWYGMGRAGWGGVCWTHCLRPCRGSVTGGKTSYTPLCRWVVRDGQGRVGWGLLDALSAAMQRERNGWKDKLHTTLQVGGTGWAGQGGVGSAGRAVCSHAEGT